MKQFFAAILLLTCSLLCARTPVDEFNRQLGIELLKSGNNAWYFPGCRARLQKSQIKLQSSPGRHSAVLRGKMLLGSPCQELVILTDSGNRKIEAIELVYANKGDVSKRTKVKIRQANKNLKARLTAGFGTPEKKRYGSGSKRQQNKVEVWQCGNFEIILNTEKDEYCLLIIRPQQTAGAKKEFQIDSEALKKNVKRNDFGDVYLTNIPMVDQGSKGYCAVATAARVMLYFGLKDLDQHKLADEASSDSKNGTYVLTLKKALAPVRKKYDLKQSGSYKIDMKFIARYIDMGVPIFWQMYSTKAYNNLRHQNSFLRKKTASAEAWEKFLRHQKKIKKSTDGPHICLIIGYNETTGEIAVSNSWGAHENAPSWIPINAAETVNRGCWAIHP